MSKSMYNLVTEPVGETYRSLLRVALDYCTSGLVVVRKTLPVSDDVRKILEDLSPFLIDQSESSIWPGTQLVLETAVVYKFRFVSNSLEILIRASDSLYSWQQPDRPEDLCLFRANEEEWLVTIAHEREGYLRLYKHEVAEVEATITELNLQ